MTALLIPLILTLAVLAAMLKGADIPDAFSVGARQGLQTILRMFPPLLFLLTAVAMFRASGALDAFTAVCAPLLRLLGIPPETAPLLLVRPLSGSGALAVGSELIGRYGADSIIGRTAAVMLGSTETTFYVISVYFGAAGVKPGRGTIPAALCADLAAFLMAAWMVRLM